MDWMAKILGMGPHFQIAEGTGGGVILVRSRLRLIMWEISLCRRTQLPKPH
jgi:hypothetical protein